ncbi:MAG TPA: class I SAM-dependent methyltransferase [Caulobacteraceae bacterium]|nr:class I SAM-dependent methyltransferase [Caulobacteraceae bacterium]
MSTDPRGNWDANAAVLTFTHPLDTSWLASLPITARVLDYGCGYGRTLAELRDAGWRNTIGVDLSGEMIARGRAKHPDLDLRHIDRMRLAEPDGAFDAALLFAVLTAILDETEQDAVMAELRRLVRPGGLLYLSDYPLQAGSRYAERYAAGLARFGVEGAWTREDGGVFRHHPRERLRTLTDGFSLIAEREIDATTMSGSPAVVVQMLGRRAPTLDEG